ncbi:MAG: glycoside hydrolase family 16 protein [Caldilineaceae bacterium]
MLRKFTFMLSMLLSLFALRLPLQAAPLAQTPTIQFAGYSWQVRSDTGDPGPNIWDANNVWVDAQGLHLKLSHVGNQWHAAELYMTSALGFGTYQWQIIGPVDKLDPNIVLGLFNYPDNAPDGTNEIDIEFSRWGDPTADNLNYTVYPAADPNIASTSNTYNFTLNGTYTTHRFNWTTNQVLYQSLNGHTDTNTNEFHRWLFQPSQPKVSIPQQALPVHMNLWLVKGQAPTNNQEVEIIIKSFTFIPAGSQPPTPTLVPPTATPTKTPVPPTATPTKTSVPPTATPTKTPVPPTVTPTKTPAPPTATPTVTPAPNVGCTISLANGSVFTRNRTVPLTLNAAGATQMQVSNDAGFSNAPWQTYQPNLNWTLNDVGTRIATLLAYARFRNASQQLLCGGATFVDDVVFDPLAPVLAGVTVRQAQVTAAAAQAPATDFIVQLTAEDQAGGSGLAEMEISDNAQFTGAAWQPYQAEVLLTNQQPDAPLYVRVRDGAGNESAALTTTLTPRQTIYIPFVQH